MTRIAPWEAGVSLAVTVAAGYALCTLVFWLWPDASANFMNALFHGLDFRKLQTGPSVFTFGSFGYAALILAGWAFMLGTMWAWVARSLGSDR